MIYQIFSKDFIHRMPITIREELKQKMEDTREIIEKRFVLIFIKGVGENLLNIDPNPTSNLVYSSLIVGAIFRYSNSNFDIPVENFVNEIYETILKLAN